MTWIYLQFSSLVYSVYIFKLKECTEKKNSDMDFHLLLLLQTCALGTSDFKISHKFKSYLYPISYTHYTCIS